MAIRFSGDQDPTFEADRASLLRVVNNLLDNAIKFSPRGAAITVEAADEGDLVRISVKDEGPGIAAMDLPRVFERFYKGEQSRASSGVGLGLAIVKHTVRLHGGTAEATSDPGHGARFTVRLPAVGRSRAWTNFSTFRPRSRGIRLLPCNCSQRVQANLSGMAASFFGQVGHAAG